MFTNIIIFPDLASFYFLIWHHFTSYFGIFPACQVLEFSDSCAGTGSMSLFSTFRKESNANRIGDRTTSGLIRSIAKLGDVFHLPLSTERLNKLTENYIVDTTKIRKALGKELPVGALDGIIKTIQSFQKKIE